MSATRRADDGTYGEANAPDSLRGVSPDSTGPGGTEPVSTDPVSTDPVGTGPGGAGPGGANPRGGRAGTRLRAYWFTPTGLVILAATVVGLAVRAFLLTRPGFLTSGTIEYDDGVYLGAAIRLLEGAMPYRDYAFVQPPGILVVALPFAVVARLGSTTAALALARVASVCASAACVPLAGNLVRHRGTVAALVTCGFLAVYPADVITARTLLLEPWMNLCCLLAVNAAFRHGKLTSPRRLGWAGVALGFATAIKFWAALPAAALLGCCLLTGKRVTGGARRTWVYLGGLAAGFLVPVVAFAADDPAGFVRSTVLDQVSRMGTYTPVRTRLAYLTGLIGLINRSGTVSDPLHSTASAFAMASNATMVLDVSGRTLPYALTALGIVVLGAAYLRRPRSRSCLEWFALVVAVVSAVAVGAYSAFFYHYPAFPAPWLAIAFGAAAAAAAGAAVRVAGRFGDGRVRTLLPSLGRTALTITAVVVLALAALEGRELAGESAQASPAAAAQAIPPGACVFSDQVSFTIAADRFTARQPGCPDVLDSLAQTLVLSGGVSPQGNAGTMPRVIAGWEAIFGRAQYVWLTQGFENRIPWPPQLQSWFAAHFRLIGSFPNYVNSKLYERRAG
jgi:hypothetical protein